MPTNPIHMPDEQTRALLHRMLQALRHATLAVIDPVTGYPHLSRIACQVSENGTPVALLSGLAAHSHALAADPRAGLLIDPVQPKGDPMTWPRLSLQITAQVLPRDATRRRMWLERDPKAQIYIDLPDFRFWHLRPVSGLLNAGFGRAFRIAPADIAKRV